MSTKERERLKILRAVRKRHIAQAQDRLVKGLRKVGASKGRTTRALAFIANGQRSSGQRVSAPTGQNFAHPIPDDLSIW
jgi:hypothetical protein